MASDSPVGFTLFFGLAEGLGAILIILIAVWLGAYQGGFAWTSAPKLEFNWHPLLLSIGLIFLYGNSILVYRAFRNASKKTLKLAHAFIHILAFIVTVIGLQAVFDSHNLAEEPIPNMYSLHSWVGLSAVIMFACQLVAGLVTFMFPMLSFPVRKAYLPVHVFFGLAGFVLAVAASLMGFTEKALFSVPDYKKVSGEGLLVNIIGLVLVIYAALVVFITTETSYKRHPLPEEMLLGGNDEPRHSTTSQRLLCPKKSQ